MVWVWDVLPLSFVASLGLPQPWVCEEPVKQLSKTHDNISLHHEALHRTHKIIAETLQSIVLSTIQSLSHVLFEAKNKQHNERERNSYSQNTWWPVRTTIQDKCRCYSAKYAVTMIWAQSYTVLHQCDLPNLAAYVPCAELKRLTDIDISCVCH